MNLQIDKNDFVTAKPISDNALALLYAGVRASYGVRTGKIAYEIQFKQENSVKQFSEEHYLHELRCGWSTAESDLQLGECPFSYAYSSVGKKIADNKFEDYGCKFKIEDVIGCYLVRYYGLMRLPIDYSFSHSSRIWIQRHVLLNLR